MPAKARKKAPKKFPPKVRRIARGIILESTHKGSDRWGALMTSISDEEVGEKLRDFRKSKKVKAQDVAKAMDCEGPTLCNMEAGRSRWSAEKVMEYVDAVVALSA